jgi:hypothetical protein
MASQLFGDLGRKPDAQQQRVSDADCLAALEAAGAHPLTVLSDPEREHLLTQVRTYSQDLWILIVEPV